MLQFTLKVVKIQPETKDTITVCFKQPGLKKVKYLAGQYLTLIFRINGRIYHRPYSFSSAPNIDSNLNITVKRVPDGIVSNYIVDNLKIGDVVEVLEPMGDFILEDKNILNENHLVFWGAGSGITPLFSIIRYALNKNLVKYITLVYGNRNQETAIFYQAINELQKQYSSNFSVKYFYTDFTSIETNPTITQGRINAQNIVELVKNSSDFDTYHYICGPVGLSDLVKNTLQTQGVYHDHIFSENFELNVNPKVFEEISAQTVLIRKADQEYYVNVAKGETILEAGLNAMVDLSYSCQTGNCLLCKARLLAGELKSIVTSSNLFLEKDECLLCCSLPLTNNIKLLVS
ncbi:MAG: 2Fe-2S iron-sulfur cluster binding domain-containing protein [Sphingobacteriaceae bacterium]|nr:MAG: 2Fe-2S iron-sulfur cluster binding domain-containing protein [Sphingobacteriaceae bacterium]